MRFMDRTICEGTLGEMISDAVAAVAKNLRRTSMIKGVSRVDSLEIPEEVLREAIANAVIHREYGDQFCGQSIAVDVFDDRIEVTNPGGTFYGWVFKFMGGIQIIAPQECVEEMKRIARRFL